METAENLRRATSIAAEYAANGRGIRQWAEQEGLDVGELMVAADKFAESVEKREGGPQRETLVGLFCAGFMVGWLTDEIGEGRWGPE